jgi:hypothetical protein
VTRNEEGRGVEEPSPVGENGNGETTDGGGDVEEIDEGQRRASLATAWWSLGLVELAGWLLREGAPCGAAAAKVSTDARGLGEKK